LVKQIEEFMDQPKPIPMERKYSSQRLYNPISTPDKLPNKDLFIKQELELLEAHASFPPRAKAGDHLAAKILLMTHDGNERKEKANYCKIGEISLGEFCGETLRKEEAQERKELIYGMVQQHYKGLILEGMAQVKELQALWELLRGEEESTNKGKGETKSMFEELAGEINEFLEATQFGEDELSTERGSEAPINKSQKND
jgi:hypothetical protein